MKRRLLRTVATVLVLVTTVVVFISYFVQHPAVGDQLHRTSIWLLLLLLGLYMISIAALAMNTVATLLLCKLKVRKGESLLLTAYSAVINFFGPLQSGPAFRAVYLKKKYNLNLKTYATASLVYLGFWGVFSVLMLLSSTLKWWLLLVAAAAVGGAIIARRTPRIRQRLDELNVRFWYYLALSTLIQVAAVALIYYTELRTVAPGTTFSQAIVYTGAANLALYVSLTPGAIGFRESFLVFSQHLHHISNTSIVAANILDRAVYIVLLLVLAVAIFATHAQRRLTSVTKKPKT
jgi:uncharacterized membrane protein YbhN (UPF0104 family)